MPIYLDCNATTPMEPEVFEAMKPFLLEEYGNAGSRTHEFGQNANKAVQIARKRVANVVNCTPEEVIFTSGATESNNLAILGLVKFAEKSGKRHFITSRIEHKAVLEPMQHLESLGFEVTYIKPTEGGRVSSEEVLKAVRENTCLISIMHVNNETGVVQPVEEITQGLKGKDVFFHVDAAQGFGKIIEPLKNPRIDLMSISGHKIYGPKGIGALVARMKDYRLPPLSPLMFGGGQERNLRPGTMPVHLAVGLGKASELALKDHNKRLLKNQEFKDAFLENLKNQDFEINGDQNYCIPTTLNLRFKGIDSESLMLALKDEIAISNGSACTSSSYSPSHVLEAMNLTQEKIDQSVRISWCHLTPGVGWEEILEIINKLKS